MEVCKQCFEGCSLFTSPVHIFPKFFLSEYVDTGGGTDLAFFSHAIVKLFVLNSIRKIS